MGRPQTEQQKQDSSSSDDEQPEHVGAVEFSTPTPTYDPQQQQQFQQGAFPPAQPAQFPPQSPLPQYQTQQQQQPQAYPPQQPNYAPPPPPQGPVQFPPTSNPQQATYMQMPQTPQKPAGQFNTTTGIPMQQQQFVQQPQQQYIQQPQQQFVQQMQQQQTYGTTASAYIMKPNGTVAWSTGLFDCMDDPQNAFMTAVCPCLTFGQIAEIIDNGHTTCGTSGLLYGVISLFAVPCVLSCTYRTKLRTQYDLVEAPAPDWATHFLCEPCALCQTYRELRFRGLDPAIGWQGNQMKRQMQMQQQQPQVMMAPMNQNMMQ